MSKVKRQASIKEAIGIFFDAARREEPARRELRAGLGLSRDWTKRIREDQNEVLEKRSIRAMGARRLRRTLSPTRERATARTAGRDRPNFAYPSNAS